MREGILNQRSEDDQRNEKKAQTNAHGDAARNKVIKTNSAFGQWNIRKKGFIRQCHLAFGESNLKLQKTHSCSGHSTFYFELMSLH